MVCSRWGNVELADDVVMAILGCPNCSVMGPSLPTVFHAAAYGELGGGTNGGTSQKIKKRNPASMRVYSFHSIDASSKAFTEFSERLFSFPSSISDGRSLVRVFRLSTSVARQPPWNPQIAPVRTWLFRIPSRARPPLLFPHSKRGLFRRRSP